MHIIDIIEHSELLIKVQWKTLAEYFLRFTESGNRNIQSIIAVILSHFENYLIIKCIHLDAHVIHFM